MARTKRDDSLPIAISTQGGLLSALAVLMFGMMNGARAWIVLAKAAMAFMLASAVLKLLTAGVMQAVRWKATRNDDTNKETEDSSEDLEDTADTIRHASGNLETTEIAAS